MNRSAPRFAVFSALLVLSVAVRADDPPSSAEAVGPETRTWLQLQTGNTAASATERPMPGDVAERVYKRHADSFAKPIPDTFIRESFNSNGGSN